MTGKQSEIYKVQMPIETNMTQPMALVYNEMRSVDVTMPVTDSLLRFMAGSVKKFIRGRIEDGNIVIDSEVPWQDW